MIAGMIDQLLHDNAIKTLYDRVSTCTRAAGGPIKFLKVIFYGICIMSLKASTMKASASAFVTTGPICTRPRSRRATKAHIQQMNLIDSIEKLMIGSIFPENEVKTEDPDKELASFTELALGTMDDIAIAHNSLTAFLLEWGRILEKADGSEGLTTPIFCIPFSPKQPPSNNQKIVDVAYEEDVSLSASCFEEVIKTSGVKISFRKTKRYLSKNEQRGLEKGQIPDRKGAKIDLWSPGGILLLIQTVSCDPSTIATSENAERGGLQLRLLAKRCDIDGDTIVKTSSERTIIRRLHDAIRVWKKMRSM